MANCSEQKCVTILVVEDDSAIRFTMRELLESEGYTVDVAADGEDGLEKLLQLTKPVLVLLDLLMPKMSGHEFIQRVEKDPRYNPLTIVIISAQTIKTRPPMAADFVSKPFDLDALFTVVRKYCEEPKRWPKIASG